MARGGEGWVSGAWCCPEMGIRCFLSTWAFGASEPVQEEGESKDHLHTYPTQGNITDTFMHYMIQYGLSLFCFLNGCNCAHLRKLLLLVITVLLFVFPVFHLVHGPVLSGRGGLGFGAASGGQDWAERGVTGSEEIRARVQSKHRRVEVSGEAERGLSQPPPTARRCQQPATTLLWCVAAFCFLYNFLKIYFKINFSVCKYLFEEANLQFFLLNHGQNCILSIVNNCTYNCLSWCVSAGTSYNLGISHWL